MLLGGLWSQKGLNMLKTGSPALTTWAGSALPGSRLRIVQGLVVMLALPNSSFLRLHSSRSVST